MPDGKNWYQLPVEEAFEALNSGYSGLTSEEAKIRLDRFGYNELKFKKKSPVIRLLMQFHSGLIYILLISAVVTTVLDMLMDTLVILSVVIANAIIGFIQEGKAEESVEALKNMMVPECLVTRDGRNTIIPTLELVPGDVVLLEGGNSVPADLRLFYAKHFRADESALTGESVPVPKNVDPILSSDLAPGDQHCMAFSGTFITQGSGQGIVVGTGEQTEIGRIAKLMTEIKKITTPLMKRMNQFSSFLVKIILIITFLNFILAIYLGHFTIEYAFLASVSLAVAAIPEGLPAIVTITLAIGVTAMARKNALVKRLPAAETLGSTTVICSDKTGTLTKNQMTVSRIYCGGKDYTVTGVGYDPKGEFIAGDVIINPHQSDPDLVRTLMAGYMCNDSVLVQKSEEYSIIGDPTEGALVVSAEKAGIVDINEKTEKHPRIDLIPFESEQQYMATLHEGDSSSNIIYVKGSPEQVLKMCKYHLVDGVVAHLDENAVEIIENKAGVMAQSALRVLAMACKTVNKDRTSLHSDCVKELTFLGLQGMIDPPREEVIEAVAKCRSAGIRTVMITGDHALTAKAIAEQLGICGPTATVLRGDDISHMSDNQLYDVVESVSVYARVAPEHKYRITKQLQHHGHIVAVTGDGVNDAPALKAADIGIAMGITGTDVSKEASDMILIDDNFASIVGAVEEGRYVFDNIKKVILYTLPTNGGQALLVIGALLLSPFLIIFNNRLPIEPVQILWINLLDAVALALPIIMEPMEKGLLKRSPRDPNEKITAPPFFKKVGLISIAMAAAGFFIYFYYGMPAIAGGVVVHEDLIRQAQTAAFTTVIMVHLCYLITARSITESAFTFSPFSNRWLLAGIAITICLQLLLIYGPLYIEFNPLRTEPIPIDWWGIMFLAALPGFFIIEIEKFLTKRFGKGV
ncbi:MAG TPA: HAD-IC family P-type ATPase [Candidatus Nanoarchaeia archaeon]|nr:HAD-IC family P-type ATPase [Candidatus Nanoarchaeia archaeon]